MAEFYATKFNQYQEEYVGLYIKDKPRLIKSSEKELIYKLLNLGVTLYEVKEITILADDFDKRIEKYIIDYAKRNGFRYKESRLKLNFRAFCEIKKALKEYINSLGDANRCYKIMKGFTTVIITK